MRAEDVIETAMCVATEGEVTCQAIRFRNVEAAEPPCMLWRISETEFNDSLDGPDATIRYFEIESRMWDGLPQGYKISRGNADLVTAYLQRKGILSAQVAGYDEIFDRSQQQGEYFSYIMIIGLPAEIDEGIGREIEEELDFLSPTIKGGILHGRSGEVRGSLQWWLPFEGGTLVGMPGIVQGNITLRRFLGVGSLEGLPSEINGRRVVYPVNISGSVLVGAAGMVSTDNRELIVLDGTVVRIAG